VLFYPISDIANPSSAVPDHFIAGNPRFSFVCILRLVQLPLSVGNNFKKHKQVLVLQTIYQDGTMRPMRKMQLELSFKIYKNVAERANH